MIHHPDKLADDPFVFFGLLLLVPASYLWRWAVSELKALDEMDALPLGRPRSAAMGRSRVFGRVEAIDGLVVAPVSGESVVWYRWERTDIDEWDVDQAEPAPFAGASSEKPFKLVDGDSAVIIEPKNARAFRTSSINHWYDAIYEPKTEQGRTMLGKHPAREWRIRPGELMTVTGLLRPGHGEDALPHVVDASPETPLLFAVGWDRAQAWEDRRKARWAKAAAILIAGAAMYLIL